VQRLLERIETEIKAGRFDYGATFPGSARALEFAGASLVAGRSVGGRGATGRDQEIDRTLHSAAIVDHLVRCFGNPPHARELALVLGRGTEACPRQRHGACRLLCPILTTTRVSRIGCASVSKSPSLPD